jgi:hypothetical protein
MKTAIIGSRTATDYEKLKQGLEGLHITEVLTGGAQGADQFAERYAREHGLPCTVMIADWSRHGIKAGPIRNGELVAAADQVVAYWDGESRGTADTICRLEPARDQGRTNQKRRTRCGGGLFG